MQTELNSKQITIYYDDKSSGIGKKDGTFIEIADNCILIKNLNGAIEIIPLYKVVRAIFKMDTWRGNG